MAIREIPKSYEYICDRCGSVHTQHNPNGYYTDGLPLEWGRLKFTGSHRKHVERMLCTSCSEVVECRLADLMQIGPIKTPESGDG
jgi:hypothetical protein